ncbi:MAG: hypothetical protein MJ252_29095 [archaeon]|nr:hypothetical protein [archaeon]
MKAIVFLAIFAAALSTTTYPQRFLKTVLKQALFPFAKNDDDPATWLFCENFEPDKEYYTVDECEAYGVKAGKQRKCCQAYANITITFPEEEPQTQLGGFCVQIRNDPNLHKAILKVASEVPSYLVDLYPTTINDMGIVCPTE